ncbi:hypothetical protein RvVAT039_23440 [Agrobacterium vitis]|nr:hypothetical protein RvVAT039_23440 [Agrobacterium vitis]
MRHIWRRVLSIMSWVARSPDALLAPRCLIPDFNGALFSLEWKEALWARFYTVAPQRQRQSVEQHKIVKRA